MRAAMLITDYTINHQGFDWPALLQDWAWMLPQEFTVWFVNRYGDLFLAFEDGSIHMLDIGNGSLNRLAESRDSFCVKIDEDSNANDWLMIPLVDKLVEVGKDLQPDQCYSFMIPPALGGEYTVDNTAILSVTEHYRVYASIHRQIKDLPDGAKVRLRTEA
jgi:hypothetical protein